MKIIIKLLFTFFPFLVFSNEFKLICEIKNKLNNENLSYRFSKIIDLDKKTVENISGNFFDKIIIFNNHEIVMHNDVFNTSSSFYIQNNQWTSFNEYFVDIYACEKKRY